MVGGFVPAAGSLTAKTVAKNLHSAADDMQKEKGYTWYCPKLGTAKKPHFKRLSTSRRSGFFALIIQNKEDSRMSHKLSTWGQRLIKNYWSLVAVASALIFSLQPVLAETDTIWTRFSTIMKDVYGQLVGISTIVGVTAAAVALLIRMISRNQRAVDEASSWLKRIIITWVVLNTLGFAVAYLNPLIENGMYK